MLPSSGWRVQATPFESRIPVLRPRYTRRLHLLYFDVAVSEPRRGTQRVRGGHSHARPAQVRLSRLRLRMRHWWVNQKQTYRAGARPEGTPGRIGRGARARKLGTPRTPDPRTGAVGRDRAGLRSQRADARTPGRLPLRSWLHLLRRGSRDYLAGCRREEPREARRRSREAARGRAVHPGAGAVPRVPPDGGLSERWGKVAVVTQRRARGHRRARRRRRRARRHRPPRT